MSIDIPIVVKSTLRQSRQAMSKAEYKNSKLPIKPDAPAERLQKPSWIRSKLPSVERLAKVNDIKKMLREANLHSVCEEASCPNLPECFAKGTATFMIMGDICTRKCPFCDVAHGRPKPLDKQEPQHLAQTIQRLGLQYVVITSVDRDDLKDAGAQHFADCIQAIREKSPQTTIEILTPDFRRAEKIAVQILAKTPPDVFNHNLETVPRLYAQVRPGADYRQSLRLIKDFKQACPEVKTKSGIMVGLGENSTEVHEVLQDLRQYNADMLTIGQYLQPSPYHLHVQRYVSLEEFADYAKVAEQLGFRNVASAPMVRSSYHADLQAEGIAIV